MPVVSACMLDCPDACSFLVDADKKSIRANPEHPFTRNVICRKGARFFERLGAPERIVQPLLRKGAKGFQPVSWDAALDLVAERINALRKRPEAVLHLRGYGYRGVLAQASLRFFAALGSSTTHGSLCDEAGIAACIRDFGALEQNDPDDLLNAARIVNWGKDLSRSSTHMGLLARLARRNGARILSISPGGDDHEQYSDRWVRIRPGTDRFLGAWVLRALADSGAIRPEMLKAAANGPEFLEVLRAQDPDALLAACGVEAEEARAVLDWYAQEGPTAAIIGWGLQRHVFGGQNVRLINALSLLSGNIGRSGGGAYFNISSGRNLGTWEAAAPGRPLTSERRSFSLPMLAWDLEWADPSVELVWVDGHNVVNQVPDSTAMARALRKPFVVCVDAFMHDTARSADLILPPALMLEREDIVGSCLHHYVNYSGKAVEPRGQCRGDFDMLRDLGTRLAPPVTFPEPEECLRLGLKPLGLDLEAFRDQGFVRAAHPMVAFEGLRFGHPDGLYRFPERIDSEPPDDPDYPLHLLTLVRGRYMHSQIPAAEMQGLPVVAVSPRCPELSGVDLQKDVFLATPLGRMAVRLKIVDDLHPLAALMRRDGWVCLGHGPNAVIEARETDMGHCAAYYSQLCRLENA